MERALLEVLAANADSLRVLRVRTLRVPQLVLGSDTDSALALIGAAPRLERLDADVACYAEDAPRLMRGEAPWGPLRIHGLDIRVHQRNDVVPPAVAAVLADANLQPTLSSVRLRSADIREPRVFDALVDGLLARRVLHLVLSGCTPPAAAPLARLLAGGALTALESTYMKAEVPLFDTAGAALVADALRLNTTLTTLEFAQTGICIDMTAACTLLGALVGHPSLNELVLWNEHPRDQGRAALCAALAALVAADAPALQCIEIMDIELKDDGMAPIVNALRCNRHLRDLDVTGTDMSEDFTRDQLLPAIRANTGLQAFRSEPFFDTDPSMIDEAMDLVADRAQRR